MNRGPFEIGTPALGAIAFLALWWIVYQLGLVDPVLLPSPEASFKAIWDGFVGGFVGSPAMNLVRTRVQGDGAPFGSFTVPMSPQQRSALGSDGVVVGARPEAMRISANGDGLNEGLPATIVAVEELGSDSYLYCETQLNGAPTMLTVRSAGLSEARPGDRVMVAPDLRAVHLFDEASGRRLPD